MDLVGEMFLVFDLGKPSVNPMGQQRDVRLSDGGKKLRFCRKGMLPAVPQQTRALNDVLCLDLLSFPEGATVDGSGLF